MAGQPKEPRKPSARAREFARERRARKGRAEAEPIARRASPGTSRASFKGEHLGKTNKGVESRASVMGTYASDDSDDEESVVSVMHQGELVLVAAWRATQIRHVLLDGPPDSEEDTPPAVRVRRGDLDPFALQRRASAGASSRIDAGRGPSRLSRRGERHASSDRHVVWRDDRTTKGDPQGFGSRRRDACGRHRRSIRESSPPRYRDAYGDAHVVDTIAETVADAHHYASPTLLAAITEHGRVTSLARRYEDPRFLDPEPLSDVPEFRLGVERRDDSPGGLALNARASTIRDVDAARDALDDVARHLRDAHERSAEKMRALARAVDAREDRLAESARKLRDVMRRLTGVLAAVDGDGGPFDRSVDLKARNVSHADLDARATALRAAAAEKAAETASGGRERNGREPAGAANEPSPAEVTPALTRSKETRAPAERTPAIPRERLAERFPEKTSTVRAVRTPAGALALSRTRQAVVTVLTTSAMKPSAGGEEAGAKEVSARSTARPTRAFGGVTTGAAAASGPAFEASRPPADSRAAAVAQSRMVRTRW